MPESGGTTKPRPSYPRSRAFRALQLAVIRSNYGRLRALWLALYELFIRVIAGYLRRGVGAGVYVKGSFGRGEPVVGLSDVGLVAIVPEADRRLERRWNAAARVLPPLRWVIKGIPVYSETELPELATTCFAYGLGDRQPRSLFFPPGRAIRVATLPGLWATQDWRLVSGPDLRPRIDAADPDHRRLAVWLELQSWWRLAFRAATKPDAHWSPYLCLKLVAEPARILLWLDGEQHLRREAVLRRSLEVYPEERATIEYALTLGRQLDRVRVAPLDAVMPCFVRLSRRIAERLAAELEPHGTVDVRLQGANAPFPSAALPLCDWRAIVRPAGVEECFVIQSGRVDDPAALARAGRDSHDGTYITLVHDGLMFRPSGESSSGFRALACEATDPVSAALAAGREAASFPNVRGWSATDTATRAVAEHAAWLRSRSPLPGDAEDGVVRRRLAGALSAARAALFHETLVAGDPMLPVTLAAVAQALSEHTSLSRGLPHDANDWYDGARSTRAARVNDLVAKVDRMDSYRRPRSERRLTDARPPIEHLEHVGDDVLRGLVSPDRQAPLAGDLVERLTAGEHISHGFEHPV